VSSSDQNDNKSSFSNYGSWVDLAAPGSSILSTNFVGTYSSFNGTSMASPHVAGLVALVWASYSPNNATVVNRIYTTANKSALAGSEQGRINAAAAVGPLADTTPPHAPSFLGASPQSPSNDNSPEIYGNAEAGSTVSVYTNSACSGTAVATGGAATFASPGLTVNVVDNTTTSFYATARDAAGNTSACSSGITYVESSPPAVPLVVTTGYHNCSVSVPRPTGDLDGYETNGIGACADGGTVAFDSDSGTNTTRSCTNAGKDRHIYRGYGFTLPADAVVQGIEVRLDAWADSSSGINRICLELFTGAGGTGTAPRYSALLSSSEKTLVFGSASDTWGRSWTANDVNNLIIRVTNISDNASRDFSLDWIRVRVTYTAP
jgi:hypothetical protein